MKIQNYICEFNVSEYKFIQHVVNNVKLFTIFNKKLKHVGECYADINIMSFFIFSNGYFLHIKPNINNDGDDIGVGTFNDNITVEVYALSDTRKCLSVFIINECIDDVKDINIVLLDNVITLIYVKLYAELVVLKLNDDGKSYVFDVKFLNGVHVVNNKIYGKYIENIVIPVKDDSGNYKKQNIKNIKYKLLII